jgi:hypothetical protein
VNGPIHTWQRALCRTTVLSALEETPTHASTISKSGAEGSSPGLPTAEGTPSFIAADVVLASSFCEKEAAPESSTAGMKRRERREMATAREDVSGQAGAKRGCGRSEAEIQKQEEGATNLRLESEKAPQEPHEGGNTEVFGILEF